MAETFEDVVGIIQHLPYRICDRKSPVAATHDDYELTHKLIMDDLAGRLAAAYHDAAFGASADVHALDGIVGSVRDLPYESGMSDEDGDLGSATASFSSVTLYQAHLWKLAEAARDVWRREIEHGEGEPDGTFQVETIDGWDVRVDGGEEAAKPAGIRIDCRPDAREELGYVVAYEPDVDGLTVRDPRDVSPSRFEALGAFPSYEAADAFIRLISKEFAGGKGWKERIAHPYGV